MRISFLTPKAVITVLVGTMLALFAVSPASATTDPNLQGGTSGVIYFTEQTEGAIYIGDFSQATKTLYWQDPLSKVDQVAVTERKVAWASSADYNGQGNVQSNMRTQVKIADAGSVATNVITVTIPGSLTVMSLSADPFGERFFLTTKSGDIWILTSDGQTLTKVFDGTTNLNIKNVVSAVYYGSWFDPYNSNFYFCAYGTTAKSLMKASVTGTTMTTPVEVLNNSNQPITIIGCDGLGVNPSNQEIFALGALGNNQGQVYKWSRITSGGVRTDVTSFVEALFPAGGKAPSSMFISNIGSKMYFSTEVGLYESNFDGTSYRTLYTGISIQNIAVYYGATLSSIDSVVQSLTPLTTPSTPSSGTGSSAALANTGISSSLFVASGALGLSLVILGGVMVFARRMNKK